jgi:hypothetical protein
MRQRRWKAEKAESGECANARIRPKTDLASRLVPAHFLAFAAKVAVEGLILPQGEVSQRERNTILVKVPELIADLPTNRTPKLDHGRYLNETTQQLEII